MERKLMYKIDHRVALWALTVVATILSGCNGFLNVTPSNAHDAQEGITNLNDANYALNGCYHALIAASFYGGAQTMRGELGGEDVQASTPASTAMSYYGNNYSADDVPDVFWSEPYAAINRTHTLLRVLNNAPFARSAEANQLKGETMGILALCHFTLLQNYGLPYLKDKGESWGVPLVKKNLLPSALPGRNTTAEGYEYVVSLLQEAIGLLDNDIRSTQGRFNKWAAQSLLARVYLNMGNYDGAYQLATEVVDKSGYRLIATADYVESWKENFTSESVLEFNTPLTYSGNKSLWGYQASREGANAVQLTEAFITEMRTDEEDVRWGVIEEVGNEEGTSSYYSTKYSGQLNGGMPQLAVNNVRLIRLSDIYLMAAEAALLKNQPDQQAADRYLNAIVQRANPNRQPVTATLETVMTERRKELVMEGHRYYDILRSEGHRTAPVERRGGLHFLADTDMLTVTWNDYRCVLPIPTAEIEANPTLRNQQNNGY